jgi:Bacterial aa3 type cytochrome c oxidase subunit IV
MAEYKHGEMDTTQQEKTFDGFLHFWFYVFGGAVAALIFLALVNA